MKSFLTLLLLSVLANEGVRSSAYTNEHLRLEYPEDWIVRPIDNTSKENYILEVEKLFVWSPLRPDEDRKVLKLTTPSSIYYNKSPSLKKLDRALTKAAKKKLEHFEVLSTEEGVKEGVPFIKTTFTNLKGAIQETTEYYVFSTDDTPYVLYLTASTKEYNAQRSHWNRIWQELSMQ